MAMNLIKQFNEFRRHCQNHKLSANAQALYYELLGRFNDQRRQGELIVNSGTLTAVLNIDYAALEAARKQLERHKLITRTAVRSQASSRYCIVELPIEAEWRHVSSARAVTGRTPNPIQSKAQQSSNEGGIFNEKPDQLNSDGSSKLRQLRRGRQILQRSDGSDQSDLGRSD